MSNLAELSSSLVLSSTQYWWIAAGVLFLVSLGFNIHYIILKKCLAQEQDKLACMEDEEYRLFKLFHELTEAVERDTSIAQLYRVISHGAIDVFDEAKGAGIYLLDRQTKSILTPKYLSEDLTPLVKLKSLEFPELVRRQRSINIPYKQSEIYKEVIKNRAVLNVAGSELQGWFKDGYDELSSDLKVMVGPLILNSSVLGILVVTGKGKGAYSRNDQAVFEALCEQSSHTLGNAILHRDVADKRRLDQELFLATEVQKILLPRKDPEFNGYQIHGINRPARMISGDYFDYVRFSKDELGVIIGDVTGKGVSAGLLMSMCRSTIRSLATREGINIQSLLPKANELLFNDMREDMFITVGMALIDREKDQVAIARAGHESVLWYHAKDRTVSLLNPKGIALGLDEGPVFERMLEVQNITLETGDIILLTTDGIREAENLQGEQFGLTILEEIISIYGGDGVNNLVAKIEEAVADFSQSKNQLDDITVVAIQKS